MIRFTAALAAMAATVALTAAPADARLSLGQAQAVAKAKIRAHDSFREMNGLPGVRRLQSEGCSRRAAAVSCTFTREACEQPVGELTPAICRIVRRQWRAKLRSGAKGRPRLVRLSVRCAARNSRFEPCPKSDELESPVSEHQIDQAPTASDPKPPTQEHQAKPPPGVVAAAWSAVIGHDSYKEIDPPGDYLELVGCIDTGDDVWRCQLFREVATPCHLGAPAQGSVCTQVIVYRVWEVEVAPFEWVPAVWFAEVSGFEDQSERPGLVTTN